LNDVVIPIWVGFFNNFKMTAHERLLEVIEVIDETNNVADVEVKDMHEGIQYELAVTLLE
jgi:hypothetical protein